MQSLRTSQKVVAEHSVPHDDVRRCQLVASTRNRPDEVSEMIANLTAESKPQDAAAFRALVEKHLKPILEGDRPRTIRHKKWHAPSKNYEDASTPWTRRGRTSHGVPHWPNSVTRIQFRFFGP